MRSKSSRRALTADIEFRQRFIREADLAATLFHPHIVGVHDRGEYDDQLWISMDYIDGTDAAQFVRDRYPAGMPADEALAIATALAGALDHAHMRGLLHRDVKPANILLSQPDHEGQRRIFLADFGIARPLADPSGLTATNLTVGTVAYAAPEQLMGEESTDAQTNTPWLPACFTYSPVRRHIRIPTRLLSSASTSMRLHQSSATGAATLHVWTACFRLALAKSPSDRFESCGQFAKAFQERLGAESMGEQPTQTGVTVASPLLLKPKADTSATKSRQVQLRNALLAIIALGLVGIVAAAIYFVRTGDGLTSTPTPRGTLGPVPGTPEPAPGATSSCNRSSSCDAADVHGDRALTTVTTADAGT